MFKEKKWVKFFLQFTLGVVFIPLLGIIGIIITFYSFIFLVEGIHNVLNYSLNFISFNQADVMFKIILPNIFLFFLWFFFEMGNLFGGFIMGLGFKNPIFGNLSDPKIGESLSDDFARAGLPTPSFIVSLLPGRPFFLIKLKIRKYFSKAFAFPKWVLAEMNLEELKALVLSRAYLVNREPISVTLPIFLSYFICFLLFLMLLFFVDVLFKVEFSYNKVLSAFFTFVILFLGVVFRLKKLKTKKLVFEGDVFALKNGVSPLALRSALEKLDNKSNRIMLFFKCLYYPTTQDRVEAFPK